MPISAANWPDTCSVMLTGLGLCGHHAMKVLRRLLYVCGALFLGLAGLIGAIVLDGRMAAGAHQQFVQGVLEELSETWSSDSIADRVTTANLAELRHAESNGALQEHAKLGRLLMIEHARLVHHGVAPQGRLTTLHMVGVFENGRAKVHAVVLIEASSRKLAGLSIVLAEPMDASRRRRL